MSDISRESLSAFFRQKHGVLVGFAFCFLFTLLIQLTGQGLLIVIAGILAGFLMKNTFRAILISFLAGFLAWLMLFGLLAFNSTNAFINAWILVGQQIPAPQIFVSLIGGVITGVGGQLGALFADIIYPPADDLGLPPGPERIPTEELPKRKRVKRKQAQRFWHEHFKDAQAPCVVKLAEAVSEGESIGFEGRNKLIWECFQGGYSETTIVDLFLAYKRDSASLSSTGDSTRYSVLEEDPDSPNGYRLKARFNPFLGDKLSMMDPKCEKVTQWCDWVNCY